MEKELVLTRESSKEDIKKYFSAILELSKKIDKFPVDLDGTWMLVYDRKSDAVEALKRDFIQDIDYQVLRQNPQNSNGGRPVDKYMLSVACLEFFIARKVRQVFEVYREVFHNTVSIVLESKYTLPDTYLDALKALVVSEEEKQLLLISNEEMKPKAEFFDAVADSKDAIDMGCLSKVLGVKGMGRNNLFEFLRENKVLMNNNTPFQRYQDMGLFRVVEQHFMKNGEPCVNIKTLVYQKGVNYIRKLLKERE